MGHRPWPPADGYNVVRHAGVTMSLYQAARYGGPDATASSRRRRPRPRLDVDPGGPTGDGAAGWADPATDVKLGAVALLAISLLERRAITGETEHDGLLVELGHFMAAQQTEDGAMLDLWDVDTGAPDPAIRSRYATGEALWALALLHETFPEEGFDTVAWPTLDYLSTRRDAAEEPVAPALARPVGGLFAGGDGRLGTRPTTTSPMPGRSPPNSRGVRWDSQRAGIATVTHPPEPRGAGFGTTI